MLRYVTSLVARYTDHPILAGMFVIGGTLALLGLVVETFAGNGLIGGFLVVYAIIAFFLGALGYAIAIGGKLLRYYARDQQQEATELRT
jgi:hypothetical protein